MDEIDFRDAYSAPGSGSEKGAGAGSPDERPDLRFLAEWERRRVLYNAVLVGEVLVLSLLDLGRPFLEPGFWLFLMAGAFGANVCFCTGPIAEAYARWLGVEGETVGWILFGLGLLLSIPLTLILVTGYLLARTGF